MKNKIKEILDSKVFKVAVYVLGSLMILFFVFQAGMIAGYKRASFSRDWEGNYRENFGSPHRFDMGGKMGDMGRLPNAHGAIGKIIKIELPDIVVLDGMDKTEKVVSIGNKTEIHFMKDILTSADLKLDTDVMVIGEPLSSGKIDAKLIRIIPTPQMNNFKTNN